MREMKWMMTFALRMSMCSGDEILVYVCVEILETSAVWSCVDIK